MVCSAFVLPPPITMTSYLKKSFFIFVVYRRNAINVRDTTCNKRKALRGTLSALLSRHPIWLYSTEQGRIRTIRRMLARSSGGSSWLFLCFQFSLEDRSSLEKNADTRLNSLGTGGIRGNRRRGPDKLEIKFRSKNDVLCQ